MFRGSSKKNFCQLGALLAVLLMTCTVLLLFLGRKEISSLKRSLAKYDKTVKYNTDQLQVISNQLQSLHMLDQDMKRDVALQQQNMINLISKLDKNIASTAKESKDHTLKLQKETSLLHSGLQNMMANFAEQIASLSQQHNGKPQLPSPEEEQARRAMLSQGLNVHVTVTKEDVAKRRGNYKRVIFSINNGRSGSAYLARVLNSLRGVSAVHEPHPPGGCALNMQNIRLNASYPYRRNLKLNGIIQHFQRFPSNDVYVETCPNFKTWFWDVILREMGGNEDDGYHFQIDIIVLRKYIPALLKSIYSLGWFTKQAGYSWLPTANSVNSVTTAIDTEEKLNPYQKIISYLINTEAFTNKLKLLTQQLYPYVRFYEYRSEELYRKEGVLKLIHEMGLEDRVTSFTESLGGKMIDKYSSKTDPNVKTSQLATTTLEECERQVENYLQIAHTKRIHLPELPHLKPYPGFVYQ